MEQFGSQWTDFHEIWYLRILRKSVEKIHVSLNLTRITGTLHEDQYTKEKKKPTDDTIVDVYSQQVNSTCFGHHYAHRQEKRLYKTACGVSLDVLAAVVWSRDTS